MGFVNLGVSVGFLVRESVGLLVGALVGGIDELLVGLNVGVYGKKKKMKKIVKLIFKY